MYAKKVIYLLGLSLAACATPGQVDQRLETWQNEQREDVEALKRAVEASYDRERAMAERLLQAEEGNVEFRQQLSTLEQATQILRARLDSLHTQTFRPSNGPGTASNDALSLYQRALTTYNGKQYVEAAAQFDRVLAAAPYGEWADNAQYWKGECYYGMGKFRQALAEFTKVFAFSKTEKADDAQLKIGRCYLALGERDHAIGAFRKLLEEFAESEYTSTARKELKYLGGL
jgi:TolA-binding protein